MQENSRYAVGIDIGTATIRCVVGHVDPTTGIPTVVGVGQAPNSGMRKGTVVTLSGPAHAIDQALGEAERMSGYEVNEALVSINGAHIVSTKADGMIAVGMADHEITHEDVMRIEDVATTGKIPPNREVLEVVPHSYMLDGQGGIKDPIGMNGTRLEINANVVSAMTPFVNNLQKTCEMATVVPHALLPSVMAAAKAVLTESQLESGVAVIDMGASTTGIAIFEEGDLQHVGVVPVGGANITNDLAIGLKTDPEVAEKVKLAHASASPRAKHEEVQVKQDKESLKFNTEDIDEIVEARLEEMFEAITKELKKAGRAGQLPSGVILVGGGSGMRGIAEFAKAQLGLSARIGKPTGFGGMADSASNPEFAAAVGLMLADGEADTKAPMAKKSNQSTHAKQAGGMVKSATGLLSGLFGKLKQ